MTRRSFVHLAGAAGALLGSGAAVALTHPSPSPADAAALQARLDAGEPLPPGVHVVARTLRAAGPVVGAGADHTLLVAAPELVGPVIAAAAAPVRASGLTVHAGGIHARFGARGAVVRRVG